MRAGWMIVAVTGCIFGLCAGERVPGAEGAEATAEAGATEGAETGAGEALTLADVTGLFEKQAKMTTTAQLFHLRKKAMKDFQGKPISLAVTVADVKPVVFKKKEIFSVEARAGQGEATIRISIYVADPDQALSLNVGDQVTFRGVIYSIDLGKKAGLIVDEAIVVSTPTPETAAPADSAAPTE